MRYIFIKIGCPDDLNEKDMKDSIVDAFCTWTKNTINIYSSINEEQADYVEYSIRDNPI